MYKLFVNCYNSNDAIYKFNFLDLGSVNVYLMPVVPYSIFLHDFEICFKQTSQKYTTLWNPVLYLNCVRHFTINQNYYVLICI